MASPTADWMWCLWALCAMLSFATNNFLLSAVGEEATLKVDANLSAILIVWAVAGIYGVVSLVATGPKAILEGMNGQRNLMLMMAVGLVNAAATLFLTLALATDPDSAGPITAMLPLNSVLVSALAWIILGEKLTMQDMVGIGIACLGPMCMAAADTSGDALRGLCFGLLTACCFGGSNFLRKLVAGRGAGNRSIVTCLFLAIGILALIGLFVCSVTGRGLKGLNPQLFTFAAVSGALWVIGGIFFQFALMGKAGPASAITNTNSVGVLLLQLAFYKPELKPLKIIGMGLCIAGVSVLTLQHRPKRMIDTSTPTRLEAGLNVSLQEDGGQASGGSSAAAAPASASGASR